DTVASELSPTRTLGECMQRLTYWVTGSVTIAIAFTLYSSTPRSTARTISHTLLGESAHMAAPMAAAPLVTTGEGDDSAKRTAGRSSGEQGRYAVTVRQPAGPPKIELADVDPHGRSGAVACSTCHSQRTPKLDARAAEELDEFHQGLQFSHGALGCYACHNAADADTLKLADGAAVAYRDVMTLCSQCHAQQADSYAHGAHGGMNGYWDLSRGPQQRNNCIDCHDPHAPQYPQMLPTFKPRDRFLEAHE
ncbi:MAG: hypothetical protein KDA45_17265, partial [Planctomycetales bacterium]|nr:hypothetical protein [Planctomycetales bacterium]